MRTISILGATGSVGSSTLDLVRRNRDDWRVVALTANCSVPHLAALAIEFDAEVAVVGDEACLADLRAALSGTGIEAAGGREALCEAAARPVDVTVAAIVGCAGLGPTMAAIRQGGTIALANKEALVSAGDVMTAAVAEHGATLLPVDSEHNAIFQCLQGGRIVCSPSVSTTFASSCIRRAWSIRWSNTVTAPRWRSSVPRTCACRSPRASPGRGEWTHRARRSIWLR